MKTSQTDPDLHMELFKKMHLTAPALSVLTSCEYLRKAFSFWFIQTLADTV